MTKAELIEALKDFSDDQEVVIRSRRGLNEDFLTIQAEDIKLIEGKELAYVNRKLFDCSPGVANDESAKKLISLSGGVLPSKRLETL